MRTALKTLVLIFAAASIAKGEPLPNGWSIRAYNGHSITFACYDEYGCRLDASEHLLIETEAKRICGKRKAAEFGGAWKQYNASNVLYLCLTD